MSISITNKKSRQSTRTVTTTPPPRRHTSAILKNPIVVKSIKADKRASAEKATTPKETVIPRQSESLDVVLPCDLPNVGSICMVYITNVENMDCFYVSKCDCISETLSMDILKQSTKYNAVDISSIAADQIFCAQFTEDRCFYRARILQVVDSKNVRVLYVDFGNQEVINVEHLRILKKEFHSQPVQAFQCCLDGVQAANEDQEWSEAALKKFNELTSDKELKMTVKNIEGKILSVCLYDESSKSDVGEELAKAAVPSLIKNLASTTSSSSSSLSSFGAPSGKTTLQKKDGMSRSRQVKSKSPGKIQGPSPVVHNMSISITNKKSGQSTSTVITAPPPRRHTSAILKNPIVVKWIKAEIAKTPNGLWATRLAVLYEEKFKEKMSDLDMLELKSRPDIVKTEEIIQGRMLLYSPVEQHLQTCQDKRASAEKATTPKETVIPRQSVSLDVVLPCDLPNVGSICMVYITNVENMDCFYVSKCDCISETLSMDILKQSTKYNAVDISSIAADQIFCAQFTEDRCFYRARILQVVDSKNVRVLYVDFGNQEVINVEHLRILKKEFHSQPVQAFQCCLDGVQAANEDQEWSEAALKKFNELTSDKELKMTVKNIEGKILSVCLYDESSKSDVGEELAKAAVPSLIKNLASTTSSSSSSLSSFGAPSGKTTLQKKDGMSRSRQVKSKSPGKIQGPSPVVHNMSISITNKKSGQSTSTVITAPPPRRHTSAILKNPIVVKWIKAEIAKTPNGLWATRLAVLYEEKFKEKMSDLDMLELKSRPDIVKTEEIIQGRMLLYSPVEQHLQTCQDKRASAEKATTPKETVIPRQSESLDVVLPCDLPNVGSICMVYITNVENMDCFYVSKSDCISETLSMDILKQSTKYNAVDISSIAADQIFCAQFTEDRCFYRARILQVVDSKNVRVLYVDFGNQEVINVEHLRILKKEFHSQPVQAFQCCLDGVQAANEDQEWSEAALKKFNELTSDKELKMTVKDIEGKILRVCLYDESSKSDVGEELAKAAVPSLIKNLASTPSSSSPSLSSSFGAPSEKATLQKNDGMLRSGQVKSKSPGIVEIPLDSYIDVLVCNITGTYNVYLRLIGDEYSNKVKAIQERMTSYYSDSKDEVVTEPVAGDLFALSCEEVWCRVKALSVNGPTIKVFFVDHGDTAETTKSELRILAPQFQELPLQVFQCALHGLPKTKNPDLVDKLQKLCMGEECVAHVIKRSPDLVFVELIDTSSEADLVVNDVIRKLVIQDEELKPALPKNEKLTAEQKILGMVETHQLESSEICNRLTESEETVMKADEGSKAQVLETSASTREEYQERLQRSNEERMRLRQQLQERVSERGRAQETIDDLRNRLSESETVITEKTRLQKNKEILQKQVQQKDAKLKEEQYSKSQYVERLQRSNEESTRLRQQLQERVSERGRAQETIDDLRNRLAESEKTVITKKTRLQKNIEILQNEVQQKDAKLKEEQHSKSQYVERLQRSNEESTRLRQQYEESQSAFRQARETIVEYRQDWTIPRNEIEISEKELGKGAWGWIREGTFRGTKVAVKQMHELIVSPHNKRLFEREMRIAAKCRHPNLLQFIGATNDSDVALFVTELLDTNLRTKLQERSLRHDEVLTLSHDVNLAINYLHLSKPPIVHRDISSANVLLWKRVHEWHAKLSDYGSANLMRDCSTACPGALIYAAPEANTSRQQSPKMDVYSFGLLLCEMSIRELPVPQDINKQISLITNKNLQNLVRQCTNKEPENRSTVQYVLLTLQRLITAGTLKRSLASSVDPEHPKMGT